MQEKGNMLAKYSYFPLARCLFVCQIMFLTNACPESAESSPALVVKSASPEKPSGTVANRRRSARIVGR